MVRKLSCTQTFYELCRVFSDFDRTPGPSARGALRRGSSGVRYVMFHMKVKFIHVHKMVLLDNDGFLTQLTLQLQKTRNVGSFYITMKKYHGQTKPKPREGKKLSKLTAVEHDKEGLCLFRATNGKKKLSTVVHSKDVNRFQLAYANVLKANLDNLKKRDKRTERKKAQKSKATQ